MKWNKYDYNWYNKNFENPSPSVSLYFRAEWKKSKHIMSLFSQYRINYMEGRTESWHTKCIYK